MAESRITVPFGPSAFDLFLPSTLRLILDQIPESTVEKSLAHDYILLPDERCNLKLAQVRPAMLE